MLFFNTELPKKKNEKKLYILYKKTRQNKERPSKINKKKNKFFEIFTTSNVVVVCKEPILKKKTLFSIQILRNLMFKTGNSNLVLTPIKKQDEKCLKSSRPQ